MKVSSYVRLAACSKILLSWLTIFGLISAYMYFAGFTYTDIILFFVIYIFICLASMFLMRKRLEKPKMSYVMHPMFFSATVIAFFITIVEDDGRQLAFQSVYLIFIIACYMANCYLSSFATNLTSTSGSRATVMIRHSKQRNMLFVAWLGIFVIIALIALTIPIKGRNVFTPITPSQYTPSEMMPPEEPIEIPEEFYGDKTSDDPDSLFAFMLFGALVIIVAVIIILSRKVLWRNGKAKGFDFTLPDEIEEEITVIKKEKHRKKAETAAGTSSAKIRKYFAKTVKNYYPERVDEAKTPSQLLIYDEVQEEEFRGLYEKARYSDKESERAEAGRAKELSVALIKKNKKVRDR